MSQFAQNELSSHIHLLCIILFNFNNVLQHRKTGTRCEWWPIRKRTWCCCASVWPARNRWKTSRPSGCPSSSASYPTRSSCSSAPRSTCATTPTTHYACNNSNSSSSSSNHSSQRPCPWTSSRRRANDTWRGARAKSYASAYEPSSMSSARRSRSTTYARCSPRASRRAWTRPRKRTRAAASRTYNAAAAFSPYSAPSATRYVVALSTTATIATAVTAHRTAPKWSRRSISNSRLPPLRSNRNEQYKSLEWNSSTSTTSTLEHGGGETHFRISYIYLLVVVLFFQNHTITTSSTLQRTCHVSIIRQHLFFCFVWFFFSIYSYYTFSRGFYRRVARGIAFFPFFSCSFVSLFYWFCFDKRNYYLYL